MTEEDVRNTEPGYVDFAIPREAVIHGAGKTVPIQYTVTSPCKLASSRTLPLQISVPVRLPTPVVPQATNNILDLGTFTGDADVRVEAWWFILPGQRVWLRCVGTNIDGSAYTINIAVAQEVTQGDVSSGLNEVLKHYLDENRGGFWVDYSPANGQLISRMEVTVEDYSFIDNFTMSYRA